MRFILQLSLLCTSLITYAQNNYPIPKKNKNHLFYIQHSNNHNTYVYDANVENNIINTKEPVKEYRIVYTQGGIIKPLTYTQRNFAYGMKLIEYDQKSFKLRLAASKKLIFNLINLKDKPCITVTINNNKIFLDRIYIELLEASGLKAKTRSVIFYGRDYATNKPIEIKTYQNNE